MSLRWSVRLTRSCVDDQDVLAEAERCIAVLSGTEHVRLSRTAVFRHGLPTWEPDTGTTRACSIEPDADPMAIGIEGSSYWALLVFSDAGAEADDEVSEWFDVTATRNDVSCLIAASVAIAVAKIAGGVVIDEAAQLSPHRISVPEDLIARLRSREALNDLVAAAHEFIMRTSIRID